jgi:2-phospho-L-lactate transferase/gluconeogenesis factor (CofD/UPF0052 family)
MQYVFAHADINLQIKSICHNPIAKSLEITTASHEILFQHGNEPYDLWKFSGREFGNHSLRTLVSSKREEHKRAYRTLKSMP